VKAGTRMGHGAVTVARLPRRRKDAGNFGVRDAARRRARELRKIGRRWAAFFYLQAGFFRGSKRQEIVALDL